MFFVLHMREIYSCISVFSNLSNLLNTHSYVLHFLIFSYGIKFSQQEAQE